MAWHHHPYESHGMASASIRITWHGIIIHTNHMAWQYQLVPGPNWSLLTHSLTHSLRAGHIDDDLKKVSSVEEEVDDEDLQRLLR